MTNKATKHITRHERQHKQKDDLTKEPSLHASRRKRDTKCSQPEVKNVVSNGNKHFKATNEKKRKKKIDSAVECETGRTYFCQAARMKMAEKATRPMKDRKPMQRRLTTPTNPAAAADSLFQHTRTTKERIEVDKKI
jgi:hypothetical protein